MAAHLLSALLLAIASDMDCFVVAIAYGIKKVRIGIFANLSIATVSGIGTFLSMSAGKAVSHYLPQSIANLLGSGVLIAIGIWGIWTALKQERERKKLKRIKKNSDSFLDELSYESYLENPERVDVDKSGCVDAKESVVLAFALTINNIGGGVAGGISGLNIALTTALTFGFSIVAIIVGYFLGERTTARMSGALPGVLSGVFIIILGVYEYLI